MKKNKTDICVIGGCGHVGLPLALCFADKDLKVMEQIVGFEPSTF